MNNNSQTLWVGLSFLAVGLTLGLVFSSSFAGEANLLNPPVVEDDSAFAVDTPQGPAQLEFVSVSEDDDAILGDKDAPITIIEFSDFQCPYCAKFSTDTKPQLMSEYIDKGLVKFIYRDFPLPSHTQASMAAQAAECVGEAGGDLAYYDMHDMIFELTSEWSYNENAQEVFIGYGSDLGHDIRECLVSEKFLEETNADYAAGRGYGVNATPTFFVNGYKVRGAQPFEVFQAIIDQQLAELK